MLGGLQPTCELRERALGLVGLATSDDDSLRGIVALLQGGGELLAQARHRLPGALQLLAHRGQLPFRLGVLLLRARTVLQRARELLAQVGQFLLSVRQLGILGRRRQLLQCLPQAGRLLLAAHQVVLHSRPITPGALELLPRNLQLPVQGREPLPLALQLLLRGSEGVLRARQRLLGRESAILLLRPRLDELLPLRAGRGLLRSGALEFGLLAGLVRGDRRLQRRRAIGLRRLERLVDRGQLLACLVRRRGLGQASLLVLGQVLLQQSPLLLRARQRVVRGGDGPLGRLGPLDDDRGLGSARRVTLALVDQLLLRGVRPRIGRGERERAAPPPGARWRPSPAADPRLARRAPLAPWRDPPRPRPHEPRPPRRRIRPPRQRRRAAPAAARPGVPPQLRAGAPHPGSRARASRRARQGCPANAATAVRRPAPAHGRGSAAAAAVRRAAAAVRSRHRRTRARPSCHVRARLRPPARPAPWCARGSRVSPRRVARSSAPRRATPTRGRARGATASPDRRRARARPPARPREPSSYGRCRGNDGRPRRGHVPRRAAGPRQRPRRGRGAVGGLRFPGSRSRGYYRRRVLEVRILSGGPGSRGYNQGSSWTRHRRMNGRRWSTRSRR